MERQIIRDSLRVKVNTTELEKAIELANSLTDKIKEANTLAKELAYMSDCLNFKISVTGQPADDGF